MEKLLNLLNEYEESKKSDKIIGQEYYFVEEKELARGHIVGYDPRTKEHILSGVPFESVIISKSYGFIKWLVENDRIEDIDRWKMDNYSRHSSLLMSLAIQGDPIGFLVSILK